MQYGKSAVVTEPAGQTAQRSLRSVSIPQSQRLRWNGARRRRRRTRRLRVLLAMLVVLVSAGVLFGLAFAA